MVAPNGARLTKADHPNLPMTQDEIVECGVACYAAGADGLHAHIRDAHGQHLLDATIYRRLVEALREAVPEMAVQITTEAAGRYEADVQMKVALDAGADMVSASVREILRSGEDRARTFYKECADHGIAVQHILYDIADCDLLASTLRLDDLRDEALQILFVLGRYNASGTSSPEELIPFLDWMSANELAPDWAVCAFGSGETACLTKAYREGGKCRVGFENSLNLSDGRTAAGNPEKVSDLMETLKIATQKA